MKSTGTCGHDAISSRILKLIPDYAAIYIAYAMNLSIGSGKFPKILKIARILPLSKKEKLKLLTEGYHPISNLHKLDKVFKEWMKKNMMKHIKENQILTESHHGGLLNHSTMTASNH